MDRREPTTEEILRGWLQVLVLAVECGDSGAIERATVEILALHKKAMAMTS